MKKRNFAPARVYGLLESGPVVWITTARKGRPNIMPLTWYTMMEFEPPLAGCVIGGRNASFDSLQASRECLQYSDPGVGRAGGRHRKLLRRRGRQIRPFRTGTDGGVRGASGDDCGML